MPRGRAAKGTTKTQAAIASDELAEAEKPAEEEQVGGSTMKTRGKKKTTAAAVEDKKEDVIMGEQKKRGRKRKSAESANLTKEHAILEAEKSEESAVPEVKKDEVEVAAKEDVEEDPKEDAKDKEEDATTDTPSQQGEIKVNRAPVLTMWVAAVAERQGFNFDEAVTFGKAISSLFAQSKGKRIGIVEDSAKEPEESGKKKSKKDTEKFEVFGNSVYGKTTDKGRFAVESGKAITPNTVKAYLHRAFKNDYDRVKEAFETLANSFEPEEIGGKAYNLYEKFRPIVPDGAKGWGARGLLDLKHVHELAA